MEFRRGPEAPPTEESPSGSWQQSSTNLLWTGNGAALIEPLRSGNEKVGKQLM